MFDRSCLKALLIAGLALPIASCSNTGLSKIVLAPASVTMTVGQYVQFTAWGYYGNGSATVMPNQNITSQITWGWGTSILTQVTTAQAPNCAVPVKGICSGLFLAVGVGTTTVGANAPGFGGTVNGGSTVIVAACTTNCGGGGGSAEPITALSITPGTDSVAVVGQTGQFIALGTNGTTGLQQNVTNTIPVAGVNGITWSSTNAGVATICTPGSPAPCTSSTNGLATATGTGTTQITAIWTNPDFSVQTATATFTVTGTASEPLQSLAITPSTQTVLQGQFSQLIAIGTFSSTAPTPGTQNLTNSSTVTWASSNKSVASVTAGGANCATPTTNCGGLVTANGPGTAVLTAIASNPDKSVVTATATITVTATGSGSSEPYVSLAIVPVSQTLTSGGQTGSFIAIGTTGAGSTVDLTNAPGVTWSANSSGVASLVSNGVFKAVANGATAITVEVPNPGIGGNPPDGTVVSATGALTVAITGSPEPLLSMSIVPGSQTVAFTGQTTQFLAIGDFSSSSSTPGDQNMAGISSYTTAWYSSNPSVATVCTPATATTTANCASTPGLVTAVGQGTTAITAIATNNTDHSAVTASATFTVTGTSPNEITSLVIIPGTQTVTLPLTSSGVPTTFFAAIGTNGITGLQQNLTNSVVWASSNTAVATINAATGAVTALTQGTTNITAQFTNATSGSTPSNVVTATATLNVNGIAAEPLLNITIYPGTQTVNFPGQTSQLVATGTFSSSPATQNLTTATGQYQVTWISSNPGVATVCSPANASLNIAANCPATPGLVTAVTQGSVAITAVASNPDTSVVTGVATFTVTNGAAEQMTSLTIIPSGLSISATGQPGQFIAIGTSGTTGLQEDVTNSAQLAWSSSIPAYATISTLPTPNPGQAQGVSSGTTNITAEYTNPAVGPTPANVVTATASVTVSTTPAAEPLLSISVAPGSVTVGDLDTTAQYLAFGTFSTTPTVLDITNGFFHQGFPNATCTAEFAAADTAVTAADVQGGLPVTNLPDPQCSFVTVTWVSLPDAFVFPINSAGAAGGQGGLITAVGSGGPELVYAVAANPDGTLVYGAPGGGSGYATFSCPYAPPTYGTITVTNGNGVTTTTIDYTNILNPGTCNTYTIGGGLLSTLTVFNASLESTGLNQTNWLITANAATGIPLDVIRCGGTAQQGSTGGSVCEATYPTGTTVTLTAPTEPGVNFGGWSSNCKAQGVVTAAGPNSCTVVVGGGCTLNQNTGTYTCSDATNVSVGAIFN